MYTLSNVLSFAGVWVFLLLIVGGGIWFILTCTGELDTRSKGNPVGRTIARYSREKEQWVQKEGIPMFFYIFGVGAIVLVFSFFAMIFGANTSAKIMIWLFIVGAIVFCLLCIGTCVWFAFSGLGTLCKQNEQQPQPQYTYPQEHKLPKPEQQSKQKHEVKTQNEYEDYEDDDWD